MTTNGILLHVYHLEAKEWETLVWGDPSSDKLGTLTQFAHTLLNIPANEHVVSVIFSGPSSKDGLIEGAFAKQYLLDHIDELSSFPSLSKLISALSSDGHDVFIRRIQDLNVGPVIKNTLEEVADAAVFFNEKHPVDKVFQIAAPSHAPRCLKNQLIARRSGMIPRDQPWQIIASEICYSGTELEDVVILEPPHRGDDPMADFSPTMAGSIRPYFTLEPEDKKRLVELIHDTVSDHKNPES